MVFLEIALPKSPVAPNLMISIVFFLYKLTIKFVAEEFYYNQKLANSNEMIKLNFNGSVPSTSKPCFKYQILMKRKSERTIITNYLKAASAAA